MINWSACPAVERDPDRVSGVWVFRGTRVPVAALFENLEDGAQLAEFVEWFPGVTLEQSRQVLEHAAHSLETAWADADGFPLTEAQRAELDRRALDDRMFPEDVVPWDEVKDSLRSRLDH